MAASPRATPWRVLFVLSALFVLAGGPQHPGGSMVEMLADPKWVPSHALMTVGFILLATGLIRYAATVPVEAGRTRFWVRLATLATWLQALEMVVHTASVVDAAELAAGQATPTLTTHLIMSVVAYPVFGAGMIGLIVAGARDRTLGSRWIAWLGIAGALAHGLAAPLTIVLEIPWARLLFPLVMLLAFWQILAGVWPVRGLTPGAEIATSVARGQ
jgi:hypothetical protein